MMPDKITVARHALKKWFDGFKRQLFVEKSLEVESKRPAIVIQWGFVIQKMSLTDSFGATEGRLAADADGRGDTSAVGKLRDSRIDSITREKARPMIEVGGRIAQQAPPLISLDDGALDPVGSPESPLGVDDPSMTKQPADHGRSHRNHRSILELHIDVVHDFDREISSSTEFDQISDSGGPIAPKPEIGTLDHHIETALRAKHVHEVRGIQVQ